jgi:hypothetical protein
MAVVDLVHPDVTQRMSVEPLVTNCRRFIANRGLPEHLKLD